MTLAILTPFHGSQAVELGNRTWRKKVLPVGDVEYKGRILHFTPSYLAGLARAFTARAYDQVPFQLADAANAHTNDPERTRGQITGMELGDDGLYVTAQLTPDGEKVLQANPGLGVSARIVEGYQRSDGQFFTAAIQHVLGTLDPRIPGLGPWQAVEAATPEPEAVVDLSAAAFAGGEPLDLAWIPDPTKAQWAVIDARDGHSLPDQGDSDEDKADSHISHAKTAASTGNYPLADAHLARAATLTSDPGKQAQINKLHKGVGQLALQHGQGRQLGMNLAGDGSDALEGDDTMTLTAEQQARLARLLELPDDTLDMLAAGALVITPGELDALTGPAGDDAGDDTGDGGDEAGELSDEDLDALIAAAGQWDQAGLLDETETGPEGEPVAAGLTAEAQWAIDLANARAEETARELAVVTARLREEDFQAEKRRLADMGVPPYITELARPLLEGAGHAVELAGGRSVDAGQVMRKVLTEYASQARLLDLDVELGSPLDEPDGAGQQQAQESREDLVNRFKSATGLR